MSFRSSKTLNCRVSLVVLFVLVGCVRGNQVGGGSLANEKTEAHLQKVESLQTDLTTLNQQAAVTGCMAWGVDDMGI